MSFLRKESIIFNWQPKLKLVRRKNEIVQYVTVQLMINCLNITDTHNKAMEWQYSESNILLYVKPNYRI